MNSHPVQEEPLPHREVGAALALAGVGVFTALDMQMYLATMAAFLVAIAILLHMALGQQNGFISPVFTWERTLIRLLIVPLVALITDSQFDTWDSQRFALPILVVVADFGVWWIRRDESLKKKGE